jgi:hypothetical protein
MPSRQSRKRSRAQQHRRRQSMKGGRRGDDAKPKEENTGILGGLFGSDDKPDPAATPVSDATTPVPNAAETPATVSTDAPAEEKPKEEEGGMFSGLMGKKEEEPPAAEKKGKKGKRGKKGKYYTNKQLKKACARLAHNKRLRSKKRQRMYVAPPSQGNVAFGQNPYEFGPRYK